MYVYVYTYDKIIAKEILSNIKFSYKASNIKVVIIIIYNFHRDMI